jgi:hypothetical protein
MPMYPCVLAQTRQINKNKKFNVQNVQKSWWTSSFYCTQIFYYRKLQHFCLLLLCHSIILFFDKKIKKEVVGRMQLTKTEAKKLIEYHQPGHVCGSMMPVSALTTTFSLREYKKPKIFFLCRPIINYC